MKEKFKKNSQVNKMTLDYVPKEVIEREIIFDFIHQLPIESLKKLVNLKEIDPENNLHWENKKNTDLLAHLKMINSVEYTCEIFLDV